MALLFPWKWRERRGAAGQPPLKTELEQRRALMLEALRSRGGQALMAHLIERYHILTSPFLTANPAPQTPDMALYFDGQRSVVLELLDIMRVAPSDFMRMSTLSDTGELVK